MCPFCWTTMAMMTAGVASMGTVGAVLIRMGLARAGNVQADMDEARSETTKYNERRQDNGERD